MGDLRRVRNAVIHGSSIVNEHLVSQLAILPHIWDLRPGELRLDDSMAVFNDGATERAQGSRSLELRDTGHRGRVGWQVRSGGCQTTGALESTAVNPATLALMSPRGRQVDARRGAGPRFGQRTATFYLDGRQRWNPGGAPAPSAPARARSRPRDPARRRRAGQTRTSCPAVAGMADATLVRLAPADGDQHPVAVSRVRDVGPAQRAHLPPPRPRHRRGVPRSRRRGGPARATDQTARRPARTPDRLYVERR